MLEAQVGFGAEAGIQPMRLYGRDINGPGEIFEVEITGGPTTTVTLPVVMEIERTWKYNPPECNKKQTTVYRINGLDISTDETTIQRSTCAFTPAVSLTNNGFNNPPGSEATYDYEYADIVS